MIWIALALMILTVISFMIQKKEKKDLEKRNIPRFKVIEVPVTNTQHLDELIHKYDDQFMENADYRFRQARLKEEHYGEKVYRFSPAYLPVKIEGHDVYSKLDDWVKVGEIDTEIENAQLLLYINEYKDVKNLEIKKVKGDPFLLLKGRVEL